MPFTRIFKNADNEAAGRDEYAVRGQEVHCQSGAVMQKPMKKLFPLRREMRLQSGKVPHP